MLQRPQTSVVLSIEEPTSLLLEENYLPSGERRTWPVEADNGCLSTSQSEAQIPFSNSFQAVGLQSVDLCQKIKGTSNTVNDAGHNTSPDQGRPANCTTLPLAFNHPRGYNVAGPRCADFQKSDSPLFVHVPSEEPCEKPTAQDLPVCQKCLTISITDKREQTIQHIPGEIYYVICLNMDIISPFFNDYRILGEKLGFIRSEISLLSSQPTDCLLREWSKRKGKKATVGMLMTVLDEMERHDTLQLLQSWAENCSKCFACQQANERESPV